MFVKDPSIGAVARRLVAAPVANLEHADSDADGAARSVPTVAGQWRVAGVDGDGQRVQRRLLLQHVG
jgi:hypothetical protein